MHANIKISTLIGCGPVYTHVYVRVSVKVKSRQTHSLSKSPNILLANISGCTVFY